ncbi:hypothetical protein EP7_001137 [Isosphaeraceae bacterium EP7]
MVQATSAEEYLKRVSGALDELAAGEGWKPGEYHVFAKIDEEWERINVVFVVPASSGVDDTMKKWGGVYPDGNVPLASIVKWGGGMDVGELLDHVSVSMFTTDEYRQGGIYALDPGYRPIDEYLK